MALQKELVVIGADEVGYGCIAGDVVVAAYAFYPNLSPESFSLYARDSKSFSSRGSRSSAFHVLSGCGWWRLDRASPEEIKNTNLRVATAMAMLRAIKSLLEKDIHTNNLACSGLYVDGTFSPDVFSDLAPNVIVAPKQDVICREVGAASVMAKVSRDAEMIHADILYPGYGWKKNVGYPTREHRLAIGSLGLTPFHRHYAKPIFF